MASLGGERQRSPTATSVAGSGGSIVTSSVRGVSPASVAVASASAPAGAMICIAIGSPPLVPAGSGTDGMPARFAAPQYGPQTGEKAISSASMRGAGMGAAGATSTSTSQNAAW